MKYQFESTVIEWRGPAPFLFAPMPDDESSELKAMSNLLTYGWGVIPVRARIGKTTWETSLFPKDGRYLLGIKMIVQKAENVGLGDTVMIHLEIVEK